MPDAPGRQDRRSTYLSYLVRLWRAEGPAEPGAAEPGAAEPGAAEPEAAEPGAAEPSALWRVSVESAQTGETAMFADLDDLFAFLKEQTGTGPDTGGKE
jgi:hypothetical protein